YSMGDNIADINNDGLPDILTLDMLPADNYRQKLLFNPDDYIQHEQLVQNGYGQQFMSNALQLNNGNGTFSEIAQLAGISNTDWSWAPLIADFDNDGWKDIFITNGYARDLTNMDFLKFKSDYLFQHLIKHEAPDLYYLAQQIPSTPVHNYMFKNNHNLTFTDVSKAWGFSTPDLSNGAAFADLDNDGDLDLIVNNLNAPASIYRNMTTELLHRHFLKIKFDGARKNRFGLGAKVYVYANGDMQYYEQMPTQGFESSVSEVMNIGLGYAPKVDSLIVIWLGGKYQILKNIPVNQTITLKETDATLQYVYPTLPKPTIFTRIKSPIDYVHHEFPFDDFKRQPLIPSFLSTCGPVMAAADVNGDGLKDIYVGGSEGHAGQLFIQQKDGSFVPEDQDVFNQDAESTDAAAVFFDANGDGHPDLYVASGGYENYLEKDPALQDRLYLNDGKGHFTKAVNALPPMLTSKSCVKVADFNGDGHPDLFVGGRVIPGKYPVAPRSYLLENDGKGHFKDVTAKWAPMLEHIGMVTDAAWVDLNGDKKPDLIIVGEFMPITILINKGDHFEDETSKYFDKPYSGFWNTILADDFNHDGHPDLVVGNYGTNS
ncbi:MAG: VCBS repeat-containing protein, partial [Chitinophagaceae bacterium]